MKFSCLQENLSKGLNIISKAIPTKSSLPILANVLITAEKGVLVLSATNLETAITTNVRASIDEEGKITVPAKLLRDFVSTLSPGTLEAHTKDDILHVSSQKTKSRFTGVNATEFPELPVFPETDQYIELEPKTFSAAVSMVAFASGTDESRPIFTGILLSYKDELLTLASTDGFRLSERVINIGKAPKEFTAVIPAKTLLEVARLLSDSTQNIKFLLDENENLALFRGDDITIATRILDGQYPDYKRIIPKESNLKAIFSTEDFVEAVKLTNIFAKEGNSAIKIQFDPESGVKVLTMSGQSGEHVSEFSAEIEGQITEIAFSSKYLLDFLNNVKTEKIIFTTNGNTSPCLLRSEEHQDFLHIIMPMQV